MASKKQTFSISIIIILIFEYYAFVAWFVGVSGMATSLKWAVLSLYLLMTIGFWISLSRYPKLQKKGRASKAGNFALLFFMGFLLSKILPAILMVLDDIRRGISLIVFSIQGNAGVITHSVWLARWGIIFGLIIWLIFLWGGQNKYRYKIRRLTLGFDNLPRAFSGFQIVQISDIHSGSFEDKGAVALGVEKILAQQPDLILFTGDLVNNLSKEIEPYKDLFARLKAPFGVYSILGNHDYGDYVSWSSAEDKEENLAKLKRHHADMGWRLMMNEHEILKKDNDAIALLGIENWSAKGRFPKHGDLTAAYKGLEKDKPSFKILMSHDPSHWGAEVLKDFPDIDLTLSGHTHGMQFGIRWGGKWQWSPVQYMYRQWAGLYQKANQYLYVNVGFGFLGYPGRAGMRPEITVLELKSTNK